MQVREVLLAEALLDEQRHRERVAERERGRRARGRHEVQRAGLLGDAGSRARRRRPAPSVDARVAGDRDEPRAEARGSSRAGAAASVGLAAVRQRDHDVVALDHAEIAVDGLGRVQEERRRAGARQRRRDLAADDARLAHAGDDDASAAVRSSIAPRATKRSSRRSTQAEDRVGLGLQDLAGAASRSGIDASRGISRPPARSASRRTSRRSSGSSAVERAARSARRSSRCAGSSCTSRNTPSTPAATPADASGSMYSRQARRDAVAAARQLQAVRHVEDDRPAELPHHRKRAHVDDEVVVAEARSRAR